MKQNDRLLTIGQVAELLKCSKMHVRRLKEAGLLVPIDIGLSGRATWRWYHSVVERFLKDREHGF
jgi:excisionase family DNA binding protein